MDKIVILGGGGHAKVIISILKKQNIFKIVGFTDPEDKCEILGVSYLGTDKLLEELFCKARVKYAAIGVGQIKRTDLRKKIVNRALEIGFIFPAFISSRAILNEDVQIGDGTVIMDGVVINPGTSIGKYSIINTRASIDHDCSIGNFAHISPGVTLSGGIEIGNEVMIGTGASVIQNRKICDQAVVGAGGVVVKDILKPGTYVGIPARNISKR